MTLAKPREQSTEGELDIALDCLLIELGDHEILAACGQYLASQRAFDVECRRGCNRVLQRENRQLALDNSR